MLDEIANFTMEVIVYAFLGDFGTEKVLQDCLHLVPEATKGLFSIPRRFWWPLNRTLPFNFGRAMKARKQFDAVIAGVVEERRSELSAVDVSFRRNGGNKFSHVFQVVRVYAWRTTEMRNVVDGVSLRTFN